MVLISRRYPVQDGHSCQVQGPRSLILDTWYLILDTWYLILDLWSMILDLWSLILDHWSLIFNLWSMILDPWSMIHDEKPLLRVCHSGPGPVRSGSGPVRRSGSGRSGSGRSEKTTIKNLDAKWKNFLLPPKPQVGLMQINITHVHAPSLPLNARARLLRKMGLSQNDSCLNTI